MLQGKQKLHGENVVEGPKKLNAINVAGTTLTDDEVIIASSLKQFALFLTAMETEMSAILEHANQKFIQPLDKFGKEHIGQCEDDIENKSRLNENRYKWRRERVGSDFLG